MPKKYCNICASHRGISYPTSSLVNMNVTGSQYQRKKYDKHVNISSTALKYNSIYNNRDYNKFYKDY